MVKAGEFRWREGRLEVFRDDPPGWVPDDRGPVVPGFEGHGTAGVAESDQAEALDGIGVHELRSPPD